MDVVVKESKNGQRTLAVLVWMRILGSNQGFLSQSQTSYH